MAGFLYIASLVIAAASVSVLGAAFSISGLAKLFSGASMAIALMASALEFSKFVAAAFLHRTWTHLNKLYRSYLLFAIVVLSLITSMGIFGFLSDAYQTSSVDLNATQIKISALKDEQQRNTDEINRLNRSIDEIPVTRISKKIAVRKEAEPMIEQLNKKSNQLGEQAKQLELKLLDVKTKVGPLIYVARAFHQDADIVVKWLILVFVSVFDPLAICLVIATSEAIKLKSMGLLSGSIFVSGASQGAPVDPLMVQTEVPAAAAASEPTKTKTQAQAQAQAQAPVQPKAQTQVTLSPEDESIQMRFVDDEQRKAG